MSHEASQKCHLCGRDQPHEHSPEEIVIYRNGVKYGRSLAAVLNATRLTSASAVDQQTAAQMERAKLYDELLYAVGNKYPGESRHETALRYIRNAEASKNDQTQAKESK